MSCCKEPLPKCEECGCERPKTCGCANRVLSIEVDPTNPAVLLFNLDGKTVRYDFSSLVKYAETKTTLAADQTNRTLKYNGESGVSTVTAQELGSILHIADIGDVDGAAITDGSFLVYKRDSNCASGCEGVGNSWYAWNEDNWRTSSLRTLMGFNSDGIPRSLSPPSNTNLYYQLGWNAANGLSYSSPRKVTSTAGTATVRINTSTKELVYVEGS